MCDIPDYYEVHTRKARKVHTCMECFEPIQIGETYEDYAHVDMGKMWHHKTCDNCSNLRILLSPMYQEHVYECGIMGGELQEAFVELVVMNQIKLPPEILKLVPQKWVERANKSMEHRIKYYHETHELIAV